MTDHPDHLCEFRSRCRFRDSEGPSDPKGNRMTLRLFYYLRIHTIRIDGVLSISLEEDRDRKYRRVGNCRYSTNIRRNTNIYRCIYSYKKE